MRTLLIQTDPASGRREANLLRIEQLIRSALAADLIVLPEMFTTGFVTEPEGIAEADGGAATREWMQTLASRANAAITGSVAVKESSRYYNRMFFVKPDGETIHYDKRHLFSFAGEDKYYSGGHRRVVVEWRGWRILLQVCYDLRFPVFARNRNDYDMIAYSASWPTARLGVWNTLLRARAIENLCYVAGANRVGEDSYGISHSGGSFIVDFKGNITAQDHGREEVVFAEPDLTALRAFREKFPALADADDFLLK